MDELEERRRAKATEAEREEAEQAGLRSRFATDLSGLLNSYGWDQNCQTPDYMLAALVTEWLDTLAATLALRDDFLDSDD
jgi:hypothetical protein